MDNAIASLAVLKVNWDYLKKDYIENFIPFIEAIEKIPEGEYDFAEIKKILQLKENINEFSTENIVARIEKFNDSCDYLIEKS